MIAKPAIRVFAAIFILVFSCLHENRQFLARASHWIPQTMGSDPPSLNEQRFQPIKRDLPKSGVVGYVEDPPSGSGAGYFFAQYALSPSILDAYSEHDFVVGNSVGSAEDPTFSMWPDLKIIKRYGKGIFLLQRQIKCCN